MIVEFTNGSVSAYGTLPTVGSVWLDPCSGRSVVNVYACLLKPGIPATHTSVPALTLGLIGMSVGSEWVTRVVSPYVPFLPERAD